MMFIGSNFIDDFFEVRHVGDFRHFQQNAAVRSMSVSNIHVGNWHNIKYCS